MSGTNNHTAEIVNLPAASNGDEPVYHRIGYARVSTIDQDLRLQVDALLRDGVLENDIYRETVSGSAPRRPQFEAMLREMRPGDVITIWKLDRLGRTLRQILETVDIIHKRGGKLRIITQQIDTSTPMGGFILAVFGAFAELERELIRERTRAGLEAGRARGRFGGRQVTYSDEQIKAAQALMRRGMGIMEARMTVTDRNGKPITLPQLRRRLARLEIENAEEF